MAIFNSYVSLPEGKCEIDDYKMIRMIMELWVGNHPDNPFMIIPSCVIIAMAAMARKSPKKMEVLVQETMHILWI